jgi:ATP-dependent RNA helicase RhlE
MLFANLGLSSSLVRAVEEEGYTTPTPIQAQAIPAILAGRDVMGCAQTGTGKTAAFALPLLDRLTAAGKVEANPRARGQRATRCLILSPTRELTAQIGVSMQTYGRHTGLRHTVIFGGVSQHPQTAALKQGVEIIIATPGRLLDLMNQGYVHLDQIEILVLDEADQMLDMGFLPDLKRIVARLPKARQTLMFSATMPDEIRKLGEVWLKDPVQIRVAPASTTADKVEQHVMLIDKGNKSQLLRTVLDDTARGRTIVFTRTKHGADKVVRALDKAGIKAAAIHGNKSQNARQKTLALFKSKKPPVLVATDIAARGLDIDDVTHVINYDLPDVAEQYVHRIGRTARAGAEGTAISFCSRDERSLLRDIERLIRQKIEILPLPESFKVDAEPASESTHRGDREQRGERGQRGDREQGTSSDAKKKRRRTSDRYRGERSEGSKPREHREGSEAREHAAPAAEQRADRPRPAAATTANGEQRDRGPKKAKFQWFRKKAKKFGKKKSGPGYPGNANPGGKPPVMAAAGEKRRRGWSHK